MGAWATRQAARGGAAVVSSRRHGCRSVGCPVGSGVGQPGLVQAAMGRAGEGAWRSTSFAPQGNFGHSVAVSESPLLRWCPTCGRARPRGWFRRDASGRDARHWQCKECEGPGKAARAAVRRERAVGRYVAGDVKRLWYAQGGLCALCRRVLVRGYHVDHKVALARGGTNTAANLQLLCAPCNLRKGAS